MTLFKNKIFVGLLAAAAIGGLLYWWSGQQSGAPLITEGSSSPLSTDLLATLGSLNTIVLDEKLLTDEVFQSLTDFGVTIPTQNTGRRNPFAPL